MRYPHLRFSASIVFGAALVTFVNCMPKDDGSSSNSTSTSTSTTTSTSGGGNGGNGTGGSGTGGGTGGGSSSSGGGGPGMPGWTVMPLIDDKTDPNNVVFRTGNDLVSGIHFASLDDGYITTQGSGQTFGNGGAIFKAKHTSVESVAFGGNRDGLCLIGTIDFQGLDKSPDGYIALGYACDVIASHDGGKTFGIEPAGSGDNFGIEPVLAMRSLAKGALLVGETGYISQSDIAPGPNANWTGVWAPQASPSVPNPVPADQCQAGPTSPGVPTVRSAVHVSADGKFIAYTVSPSFDPQVCISNDGGKSFFPTFLPNVPMDAQDFNPSGIVFANATAGIVYWANNIYPDATYIYRTTDAGKSWAPVAIPAAIAHKGIELHAAAFSPSGKRGWIVGYNHDSSRAIILRTDDSGATWDANGGDLGAKVDMAGGSKLYSVFALDDNHVWVGGEQGMLLANDAGGI
jgi:hypothetical protein